MLEESKMSLSKKVCLFDGGMLFLHSCFLTGGNKFLLLHANTPREAGDSPLPWDVLLWSGRSGDRKRAPIRERIIL